MDHLQLRIKNDPITATIVSAVIGAGATLGSTALAKSGSKAPKVSKPKVASPLAGEDTTLKPGQKTNAINTSPQGVLDQPSTGRSTILGN